MDDRAEESIGEMPTLGHEETVRTTHRQAWNQDESIGELTTRGPGRIADKGRKDSGRAQREPAWNSDESIGELTTLKAGGIVDDGRTDAARRWIPEDVILERYIVEGELGQGGMGVVYGCLDKVGGVRVAVKCLPPELSHNSVEMEEVRENFELVVGLRHPNIAGVQTLEKDGRGEYYLVMDVAEGENLRAWLRRKWKAGGVSPEDAVGVLRQVASALDYAHGEKVVHRDVKPGNVMIDGRGRVKVLDFGLAAQIRTSLSRASHAHRGRSGTGPYMAPEQWEGQPQDGAADQYALGVMAYEMLAGRLPFENSELAVLKDAVLHGAVRDIPGVDKRAMGALRRALAKRGRERWGSCGAFVEALAGERAGTGSGRRGVRGKTLMGWGAALLVVAAVAAGVWWGEWERENVEKLPAPEEETAGEKPAPSVAEEALGALPESPLALPPEGASHSELEDALARLEARRDALVQEGYAATDPERAPLEATLAALEERIDAALEAEAEKARAAEREGRRAAAQRAADLEALGDLKKAVERRIASLDPTWQDGLFGKKRKAIDDAWKKLEACTDASSLTKAKELRGDIYDAADWIERNTPARSKLSDAEKALETLASACTAADAGKLAGGTLHKAERARKEGRKHCDAGRYEDAAAEYAAAKGFYEAALKEARRAKAEACIEEARTYAQSKMWAECMKAADSALDWDADNADAKQLKEEAERAALEKKIDQELEVARGAARREAWEKVIAAAEGVLALDARNAEALRLKATAEGQLKPSILLKATLNGREVAATVTAGLEQSGKRTPVPVKLKSGGSYSFAAEYEDGGKKYAGQRTVQAKARGVTEAVVVLEEVKETAAGDVFALDLNNGIHLEMVHCPGVAPDFWIGKYEVTQEQWRQVTGKLPSHFGGNPRNPVENVSWNDCLNFVWALNALPAVRDSGLMFRLPEEREWEEACRAGAPESADYCKLEDGTQITEATLDRVARYGNWDDGPAAVGSFQPNAWGLYDMHGNVWEWTQTADGVNHVLRGGSFGDEAWRCQAGSRAWGFPGSAGGDLGLRLAGDGSRAPAD